MLRLLSKRPIQSTKRRQCVMKKISLKPDYLTMDNELKYFIAYHLLNPIVTLLHGASWRMLNIQQQASVIQLTNDVVSIVSKIVC